MTVTIGRRELLAALGGAAAAWPVAVRAQVGERKRRIGILWQYAADDPATGPPLSAFRQTLAQLGWSENRNVDIDYRFAGGSSDRYLPLAQELIASRPDVIVATGTPITATLQRETRAIPIVFTSVSDPIGAGFVASLARPGGNITGMLLYEAGIIGKWLAMLKEIAPRVTRAALGEPKDKPLSLFPACSGSRSVLARYRTCASYHRELRSGHRACHRVVRSHGEWRLGRAAGYDDRHSSRPHHRARGPEPSACSLPCPSVCRFRRSPGI
jgi:putative ABC transport system substrate-binding protein